VSGVGVRGAVVVLGHAKKQGRLVTVKMGMSAREGREVAR